jgi:hypothetical protein
MNLKWQIYRSTNRKRPKEMREQFLVVSTKIRSTGSFVEWNEDKELGVSCSGLVVVSFPPWQSSFPPDAPYLFLFLSGCRATYSTYRRSWYCVPISPVFTWRLLALRNFSFYFFISNLVAVVLRFLGRGVTNKC